MFGMTWGSVINNRIVLFGWFISLKEQIHWYWKYNTLHSSVCLCLSIVLPTGVNVSFPSRPGTQPPLSSTQMLINPESKEFQLVDLSRRFLDQESYWTLPRQFLGNKVSLSSTILDSTNIDRSSIKHWVIRIFLFLRNPIFIFSLSLAVSSLSVTVTIQIW